MDICIIGTGYVGLVTGTCFAEMGHHVHCIDIDKEKIKSLKKGVIPIFERGLNDLVKRNIQSKRLQFTTDYSEGMSSALICFICVPTLSTEDGKADLSAVMSAAKQIAQNMERYCIVVNKSTVPVGTNQKVNDHIKATLSNSIEFDVVSNPEFLKEGDAVNDFMKPERVIIGTKNSNVANVMKELYAPFTRNHERIIVMDPISAELTKYAANAMLATRISFMNEIAKICEATGADITSIRKGIGSDSRIGHSFLYSGVGYGGSCFPKDVRALKSFGQELNIDLPVVEAVEITNNEQKELLGKKIKDYFEPIGGLKGKTVAIWGLSFKPETDDVREAPSLSLIDFLTKEGAILRLYDPIAMENIKENLKDSSNITFCKTETEAAKNVDAIALMTEWKQFSSIDFDEIMLQMNHPAFFDGRNQYSPIEMAEKGFNYISIGRAPAYASEDSYIEDKEPSLVH